MTTEHKPHISHRYVEDLMTAFAMYCDENGLTLTQGRGLAEEIGEQLQYAAEERRDYLPPEMVEDDDA